MLVAMNYPRFISRIKELEPNFSEVRLDKHCQTLFGHLRSSGLSFIGMPQQNGQYAVFQFQLTTSDRTEIRSALDFLGQVEAVTLERADLQYLVENPIMKVSMTQNWNAISPMLTRITPDELFNALENAAGVLLNNRPMSGDTVDGRWVLEQQEHATMEAYKAAGIPDPLEKYKAREAQKAIEIAEYEKAQYDAKVAQGWGEPVDSRCPHGLEPLSCLVCNT